MNSNRKFIYVLAGAVFVLIVVAVAVRWSLSSNTSEPVAEPDDQNKAESLNVATFEKSIIVRSENELQEETARYGLDSAATPDINWQNQVAAIAVYRAPTGGHSVQSATAEITNRTATIALTVARPGNNCAVTQAFQPIAAVVAVPSSINSLKVKPVLVESTSSCPVQ